MTARRLPPLALPFVLVLIALRPQAQSPLTAIVGGTVIDGTGGVPVADAVILVEGARIRAVGPRAATPVPAGATTIDATGRFILPGFIDTNVHLSLYGGQNERYETLVRYHDRQEAIVLEAAQLQLRYGVTTVRDSYGVLPALVAARDRIARGEATGARILAAGNIVGWGGPYSVSFSLTPERNLTLFQEQMNDLIAQGVGEDLVDMAPDELRAVVRAYLDKGPDFIKYGGTAHFSRPALIGFSPEAQKVIVEEAHARGKIAETHATTPDGLRLAVLAGIDLVQHPEVLGPRELPDDLVRLIVERRIVCSMLSNTITGPAWKKHLEDKAAAQKRLAEEEKKTGGRKKTSAERRKAAADLGAELEMRRGNAEKLVRAGAVVTVGTDNYWAAAPELARTPKPEHQDHGIGTIIGIEGLVELGMTPMQAVVAATRNGAIAAGLLKDLGTIEAGKLADLVVLDADPLAAIGNIRAVRLVMQEGRVVARDRLPERRVLSRPPATTSPAGGAVAALSGAAGAAAASAPGGSVAVGGAAAPAAESSQVVANTTRPAEYPIAAVPLTAVRLTDGFWRPRLERNRTVTIPHILHQNEITGRVDNFLKAARRLQGPHKGQRYNDTDVYKVIEAASYALSVAQDPELERKLDALIAVIAAAQEPDGYLYTPRTVDPKNPAPGAGPERWSYLHTSHELYNAGHLYEAAVAHYQATGRRTLLDVAIRNADLVCRVFGPERRLDAPGH